ncbi:TetR/AcrR family transcriptional regulator [Herbaspirillum sp. RV1423]|uniref:TetR/AcrR family transcriptional regulator n=1 Tax=Herbaspirillum sp. RV1423 TaxID=1443993 RepID=UPI0004BCA904|nr:TetR/AcrR family transcriptional regulator [Herbaspirillum sp. RV1423]
MSDATATTTTQREELIPVLAEIFRAYGYEGASLARITEGTGLGKGSLYHAFPGGKEEMANAVLRHIDGWFQREVFAPLRETTDAIAGIDRMFDEVKRYFLSGRKVCLVGVFALVNVRDRFADKVRDYFVDWAAALNAALLRSGRDEAEAAGLTEEILAGIQGALVLARAIDDPAVFVRTLDRLQRRLQADR